MFPRQRLRLSTRRVNCHDRSLPREELNRRVNCLIYRLIKKFDEKKRERENNKGKRQEEIFNIDFLILIFFILIN